MATNLSSVVVRSACLLLFNSNTGGEGRRKKKINDGRFVRYVTFRLTGIGIEMSRPGAPRYGRHSPILIDTATGGPLVTNIRQLHWNFVKYEIFKKMGVVGYIHSLGTFTLRTLNKDVLA